MKTKLTPKQLLKGLIDDESDHDSKLELLTNIGCISTNISIFRACEEIRNELVSDTSGEESKTDDVSGNGVFRNGRKPRRSKRDNVGYSFEKDGEEK
jgi:hypothetical protein